ncbi:hypothetical protein DXG01_017035 [Tephrocybe rancida]|nr:hypothetical protein DXG01_017035 [Tephrocybe rancida]
MSPPMKRSMRSAGNAPDIPLPQNSKMPQAPKSSKTWESKDADNIDEGIVIDDLQAPPPAPEHPVPCRKTAAPVTAAPGTNAEDEAFIPARALKKRLPKRSAAEEDAPPPSQPAPPLSQPAPPLSQLAPPLSQLAPPLSQPARCGLSSRSQSPENNEEDNETPPPPSTQPHRAPSLPSQSPHTPSPPIVRDPGFIPSPSDFEATSAEEQRHISWLRPAKRPVSQEELDKEDDLAFYKEIKAKEIKGKVKAKAKAKKGKGKARDDDGPFKSGPIPNEVKERLYAIHADFKRQLEELSLVLKEDWTKIIAFKYKKYCNDNLGPLSKDPDTCAKLMKPMLEWYAAKYGMYVVEKKTDGTFKKVIAKAQQDFVHLAKLNHKYNGLHCFGFIISLQPDHTNHTFSSMWGATPAFEQMKVTEKGVISCQIADWEGMLRVAQLQLNAKDDEDTESRDEVERQLWSVLDPGSLVKRNDNRKTFLAWLGNDIEHYANALDPDYAYKHHLCLVNWPRNAHAPDGLKKGGKPYDYKDASNGLLQSDINASNWKRWDDYLDEHAIQIVSWGDDEMKLDIEDPELPTLPLVMNADDRTIMCVDNSPKFNHDLAEAKGLPCVRNNMIIPKALRRTLRVDLGGIFGTGENNIGGKSSKAQADHDKHRCLEDDEPGPSRKKSHEANANDQDICSVQMSSAMQQQLMKLLAVFQDK